MSQAAIDHGGTDTDFRRVMAHVTEWAEADGLQEEVMAALYDVLVDAAQRRDRAD